MNLPLPLRRLPLPSPGRDADQLRSGLADLFRRWPDETGCTRVFTDGPIDPDEYVDQPRRIVFVLKEVNELKDVTGWDLGELILEEDYGRTWNNVARWTMAILSATLWADLPVMNKETRTKILSSVAVMNLNKEGGGASTHGPSLRTAAERAQGLLREQIDLLDPHVVVCGGGQTGDLAGQLLGGWEPREWTKIQAGVWRAPSAAGRTVITMPHPQARRSGKTMYEGLLAALAM
jgi:hypothetical protein